VGVIAHEQQRFIRPVRRVRRADEVQPCVLDHMTRLTAGHPMFA